MIDTFVSHNIAQANPELASMIILSTKAKGCRYPTVLASSEYLAMDFYSSSRYVLSKNWRCECPQSLVLEDQRRICDEGRRIEEHGHETGY